MSIAGYLSARKPAVQAKKKDGDALGIRFQGPVATGEKTVSEQLRGCPDRSMPRGEHYQSVADYDPVLHAHCRL
jgi:hypothetical protein